MTPDFQDPALYKFRLWRHRKDVHTLYEILYFGLEEKTLEPIVIYRCINEGRASVVWSRPCAEFFDGRFRQVQSAEAIQS